MYSYDLLTTILNPNSWTDIKKNYSRISDDLAHERSQLRSYSEDKVERDSRIKIVEIYILVQEMKAVGNWSD